MGFKDRIAQYNASKDSKVNPPEAAKVLEEKSEPEVSRGLDNKGLPPAASAAAPESSDSSEEAPAASLPLPESGPSAGTTEGKARRGRPPGSKNSPKPPTAVTSTEATSAVVLQGAVDPNSDIDDLCAALTARGFEVTLRFTGRKVGE